jgi:uncharacterized protein DUF2442
MQSDASFVGRRVRGGAVPRAFFPAAGAVRVFNLANGRHGLARYEQSPRHVIEARYLGDYKVWLEFNDGRKGVVDLADELYGDEMSLLRNRDRFAEFYLDYGLASIAWLDGQDFAPEFLYEKLKAMN